LENFDFEYPQPHPPIYTQASHFLVKHYVLHSGFNISFISFSVVVHSASRKMIYRLISLQLPLCSQLFSHWKRGTKKEEEKLKQKIRKSFFSPSLTCQQPIERNSQLKCHVKVDENKKKTTRQLCRFKGAIKICYTFFLCAVSPPFRSNKF
jgi:hypothetical protein